MGDPERELCLPISKWVPDAPILQFPHRVSCVPHQIESVLVFHKHLRECQIRTWYPIDRWHPAQTLEFQNWEYAHVFCFEIVELCRWTISTCRVMTHAVHIEHETNRIDCCSPCEFQKCVQTRYNDTKPDGFLRACVSYPQCHVNSSETKYARAYTTKKIGNNKCFLWMTKMDSV